ncbi:hypothetical protein B0H34DRAFT_797201 [Crassisporium funariophilum]|nr:hypothetical protein B0H34DRAFT_797201 [Crassisporium funariophilum]
MAEIDPFAANYRQYLATQRRVSEWVSHTDSKSRPLAGPSSHSSTHSSRSRSKRSAPRTSSHRRKTSYPPHAVSTLDNGASASPIIALISSSLIICAMLPSILTVSAFVLLLSYASVEQQKFLDPKKETE